MGDARCRDFDLPGVLEWICHCDRPELFTVSVPVSELRNETPLLTQSVLAAFVEMHECLGFDRVKVYRLGVALEYWKDMPLSIARPPSRKSRVLLLMDGGT
jgi:hypothetical protein